MRENRVQGLNPLPISAASAPVRYLMIDVFPLWVLPKSQKTGAGTWSRSFSSRACTSTWRCSLRNRCLSFSSIGASRARDAVVVYYRTGSCAESPHFGLETPLDRFGRIGYPAQSYRCCATTSIASGCADGRNQG